MLAEQRAGPADARRRLREDERRPVDADRASLRRRDVDEVSTRGELRVARAEILGVRDDACRDARALEERGGFLGDLLSRPRRDASIERRGARAARVVRNAGDACECPPLLVNARRVYSIARQKVRDVARVLAELRHELLDDVEVGTGGCHARILSPGCGC